MVALTLNTNMSSMNAQRHLDSVQAELGDTIDRIATGVKIHDAKDGGAELTLTENNKYLLLLYYIFLFLESKNFET